ncbi:mitochondrial ribonuclease P catalytic subunit [Phlebotomus papatasi]|uniref:mitochondrial ribonuclease P catalytic subunit n=1 Tax=Phlebotomus papatasi TaxID=29031 RepID=UPI0024834EB6|nr:mitochondrial ribonuclease P catalytic subunit [Phlebotomus papatasi]
MNFLRTVAKYHRVGEKNLSTTCPRFINRRKTLLKVDKSIEENVMEFLNNCTRPEASQWKNLRSQLLTIAPRISLANVDATIVGFCVQAKKLTAARGFVEFLDRDPDIGGANCATLTRLLRVYHAIATERPLTQTEEEEIGQIYGKLREKFPHFDANTSEGIIAALSMTSRWKECLELMDGIEILCKPSTNTYMSVIEAAFRHNDKVIALQILEKSVRNSRIPKCSALIAWIDFCDHQGGDIQEFLHFVETNDLQISDEVIKRLEKHLQNIGIPSWRTAVDPNGTCYECSMPMKPVRLSDEEFAELQSQFLSKVLIREDVFLKSNPKEVEVFRKFLSRTQPFDCIVDGLNVALSKGTSRTGDILAKNLIGVVRHFSRKGQKVLVLGRKHMNGWPQEYMTLLRNQAKVFLTDNLSQDDPFLLYAALTSGKDCTIVSRDLMRSHAFLLGTQELRSSFRKWQHTNQFRLEYSPGKKIVLQAPPMFSVTAHEIDGQWHVPFQPEYSPHQLDLFEIPQEWLCFDMSGYKSAPGGVEM